MQSKYENRIENNIMVFSECVLRLCACLLAGSHGIRLTVSNTYCKWTGPDWSFSLASHHQFTVNNNNRWFSHRFVSVFSVTCTYSECSVFNSRSIETLSLALSFTLRGDRARLQVLLLLFNCWVCVCECFVDFFSSILSDKFPSSIDHLPYSTSKYSIFCSFFSSNIKF